MRRASKDSASHTGSKGGNPIPALCNVLGTLLILLVILSCLPLTIPRFFGWEIYNVVSGSMEPALPVGSVIYVRGIPALEAEPGDVVAFTRGNSVVTHRVVENRKIEGILITKGDANLINDPEPVPYTALIGRVEHHIPVVGRFLMVYTSGIGKIYALAVALSGLMLNILAGQLRARQAEKRRLKAFEEEMVQRSVKSRSSNGKDQDTDE